MGRAPRFALAVALVFAACGTAGGSAGESAPSQPSPTATSTTTTVPLATTTTEGDPCNGEPHSLEDSGGRLVAGCLYRTEAFPFPLAIVVDEEGWLNIPLADPRVVLIGLDESGSGSADANLVFLALQGSDIAADALEDALGEVEATAATPPEIAERPMVRVGGHDALSVDISTGEEFGIAPDLSECTPGGTVIWEPSDWGFQLLGIAGVAPGRDLGIPACARSRIWAVELDNGVVTIVASARNQDRFEELMSTFDGFLQNHVTFGDGDG